MEPENGVYQYYTIVSDADELTTDIADFDLNTVSYFEGSEEDDSSKVMYLTFGQNEDELLPQEPEETDENKINAESEESVDNIKFVTFDGGQIFVTDTESSDENYATIDDSDLLNSVVDNGNVKLEEPWIENIGEGELETNNEEIGRWTIIDNDLWNKLVKNETTEEDETQKKQKKFPCMYKGCDKVYTTAHHLTVHIRNHTGVRPYTCKAEGCDKAFATGYSLKAHQRTHTGEKPYGCSICMKHFKTSGDLQKHFRTHTGEKPFKCPIEGCGRSFTTSNIRKVHIRSHTGERPYVCKQVGCGKAFSSATNYRNHMRIHSGEKPYVCPVPDCGKRFTEYSSLYKHNSVHQSTKPYKCCYCGLLCKQESSLRTHKRMIHNIIITQDGTEIFITKDEVSNTSLVYEITEKLPEESDELS